MEQSRAKGLAEATIKGVRILEAAFYKAAGLSKDTPLVQVSPRVAERVVEAFQKEYAPSTAFEYAGKLQKIFRAFTLAGYLLMNPFAGVRPIKKPHVPLGDVLTEEEIEKLMDAPRLDLPTGVRNRAILETLYSTAIRVAECAALNIQDIDLDGGVLVVRQGKGRKDRLLPLGKQAVRYVARYLQKVRGRFTRDTDRLWVGQEGKPVASLWIRRMAQRLAKKAGIKKRVTPHTLRRTCATHLLRAGASVVHVQQLLGHKDVRTLGRYLKLSIEDLKQTHEESHPRGIGVE